MREYGKVVPQFWTQGSGKKLRGDPLAQVVALYLFTCPSASMTGLYYLPIALIAHETGSPFEGASKALRRVCEAGIAMYDEEAEVVWLPEMARIQIGDDLAAKDHRVKGVEREVSQYSKHPFFDDFLRKYAAAYHLGLEPNGKALPSPFKGASKALRSQEQDQEHDQDQEHSEGEVDQVPDTTAREAPGVPHPPPPTPPVSPRRTDRSMAERLASDADEFGRAVDALAADLARVPAFERDDHRAFAEDLLSGARMQGASLDDARKGIAAAIFKRGRELRKAGPLERQRIIGTFVSKQKVISAQDAADADRRGRERERAPPIRRNYQVQGAGDLDLERINRESEERARAANEEAAEGF